MKIFYIVRHELSVDYLLYDYVISNLYLYLINSQTTDGFSIQIVVIQMLFS